MLGRRALILLCDIIFILIFILWLLPTAVGFCGQEFLRLSASVPSHAAKSSRFVRSATSTSTSTPRAACGRRVSRWRHCGSAVGVGGLSAVLEVKTVDCMENGCVLVAGEENFGHMTSRAVALVYEHAGGQASKAVCLDKGLTFTIGEMIGVIPRSSDNWPTIDCFVGDGSSSVIMVHKHSVAGARALGDTGLYVGGLAAAVELTDRGGAKPEDFKFFFSHLAWPDGVLEEQVEKGLWKIVKVQNDVVLDAKQSRDMELWGRIERELEKKGNNEVRVCPPLSLERNRMTARFSLRTTSVGGEGVIQKAATTLGRTDYAARSPRKIDSTTIGATLLAGG